MCRYYAGLIVIALEGRKKDGLLSQPFTPVEGLWEREPLSPKIASIAAGSFKMKKPPEIKGTGYIVDCLEAALWAFYKTDDFRSGALMAVNLGDDADVIPEQSSGTLRGRRSLRPDPVPFGHATRAPTTGKGASPKNGLAC